MVIKIFDRVPSAPQLKTKSHSLANGLRILNHLRCQLAGISEWFKIRKMLPQQHFFVFGCRVTSGGKGPIEDQSRLNQQQSFAFLGQITSG
jgi:hypothetical protein